MAKQGILAVPLNPERPRKIVSRRSLLELALRGLTVVAMLGHAHELSAECTLQGQRVRLSDVVVSPPDVPPFRVDLGGYWPGSGVDSVIMTLPDSRWGSAKLRITSAIAFEGKRQNPVLAVRRELTTNQGMVLLSPGALLTQARSAGSKVLGTVSFVLAPEDEPWAGVTLVESVASVVVPCDALGFGTEQFTHGTYFYDESAAGPASWWQLRRPSPLLVLRSQPNWEAPRTVLTRGPFQGESQFSLKFLAERNGWMNVAHVGDDEQWGSHAEVRGWIRKSELIPATMYSVDGGLSQSNERLNCIHQSSRFPPPVPAYEGPAHLAIGTRIYAEPNFGPWATVRSDAKFFVKYFAGDTWAWVNGIPQIPMTDCAERLPAYVPLTAVSIEPSAPR